jgi:hypothetical protein
MAVATVRSGSQTAVADGWAGVVRVVPGRTGIFFGRPMRAGFICTVASADQPVSVAYDPEGNLLIADERLGQNGVVWVVACTTGALLRAEDDRRARLHGGRRREGAAGERETRAGCEVPSSCRARISRQQGGRRRPRGGFSAFADSSPGRAMAVAHIPGLRVEKGRGPRTCVEGTRVPGAVEVHGFRLKLSRVRRADAEMPRIGRAPAVVAAAPGPAGTQMSSPRPRRVCDERRSAR